MGIDAYVTPHLDDTQKRVWQGAQRMGAQSGFGAVIGNLMNDNDALDEELGSAKKIEPNQEFELPVPPVGVPAPQVGGPILRPGRMIEIQKAVIKDSPKNK
jgi:hypothetical protein